MRLVCVGTGTAVPDPDHVGAGFWVEAGAARVLLDCGPGVVHGLARLELAWPSLTHLVLSHFHNDHIGDVPFLLFALRWGTQPARTAPLTVIGPRGTRRLFRRLGAAFGEHVAKPDFEVRFVELASGGTHALADGVLLRAHLTPHTAASRAYRIEHEGKVVAYTGDTGESAEVARFAAAADLLIAECSLPEPLAMDTHLTPARLARMAQLAGPRRLLVTHVYPQLERASIPGLIAAAGFAGSVEVAADGSEFSADGSEFSAEG
jgi:ribonuclease BN (tRNA processing enzyme)